MGSAVLGPWIDGADSRCIPHRRKSAGILNGWLAIDGSLDWWPLAPLPATIGMNISLAADDLTGPSVFVTAEAPLSSYDLTPVTRARGGSTRLIVIACSASAGYRVDARRSRRGHQGHPGREHLHSYRGQRLPIAPGASAGRQPAGRGGRGTDGQGAKALFDASVSIRWKMRARTLASSSASCGCSWAMP